jgi:DNA-binding CsgD family transcriptional regulator
VSEEKVLDLLYQAPGSDRGWHDFLVQASQLLRSDTAEIVFFDNLNQRFNLNYSVGIPPDAVLAYNTRFGATDEWYLQALGKVRQGYVGPGEMLCSTEELVRTEFYNEFLLPNKWLHCGAAVIERSGPMMGVMTLLRSPKSGTFQDPELRKLAALAPHLRRALFLHRRMVDLHLENALDQWSLDQVLFGVIFLQSDGKVISANKFATGLCSTGVFSLSAGILRVPDPKEDRLFQSLIRSARQPQLGERPGGMMKIRRPSSVPLIVSIVPVQHPAVSLRRAIAVFISDPARQAPATSKALQEIYGLTPAEQKLALLIAEGVGAPQAAEQLCLSRDTVKTQLASIFSKTGVNRQAQLVRLMTCFIAPSTP